MEKKIAYAKENNLFMILASKSTTQITTDGKKCHHKWYYGLGL
jgi:hypothetical protein